MSCEADTCMRRLTIGQLIDWCRGTSGLPESDRRQPAGTVLHDSRLIGSRDIFLALRTGSNDGHAYIESAFRAGASTVIAAKKSRVAVSPRYEKRIIRVADPLTAVQRAARRYRKELGYLLVCITGSAGKTTTRSFLAAVLRQQFVVGETCGNWNNHIGVPLSLLRFTGDEWVGVLEMGANHEGELRKLSKIAAPDIAVLTNIGYAHVGTFGSLAATTRAKFEITEGLNRRDGFLVLNGDDRRLTAAARESGIPAISYGTSRKCSVRAEKIIVDPVDGVSFSVDGCEFVLRMPGRHFIYSALPAILIGRRCGIPDSRIVQALRKVKPVTLRGSIQTRDRVRFIVDCYNANPSSMESAIVYLDDVAKNGHKVAVVGEMLELGRYSKTMHRQLGKKIAKSGIDRLITVGPSAGIVRDGALSEGMPAGKTAVAATADDALPLVRSLTRTGDTVLLKGSRGMALETVFQRFRRSRTAYETI